MPYNITNDQMELTVDGDSITVFPDTTAVYSALMEMHRTKLITGCTMNISDSICFLGSGTAIPLGHLTIYFGDGDPCPILRWDGDFCPDFEELNKDFARCMNLKSFW